MKALQRRAERPSACRHNRSARRRRSASGILPGAHRAASPVPRCSGLQRYARRVRSRLRAARGRLDHVGLMTDDDHQRRVARASRRARITRAIIGSPPISCSTLARSSASGCQGRRPGLWRRVPSSMSSLCLNSASIAARGLARAGDGHGSAIMTSCETMRPVLHARRRRRRWFSPRRPAEVLAEIRAILVHHPLGLVSRH